jgi:predicted CopG family antitoxin
VTKGTVQERHDTTQVRAPYIDRDVAADLAYLKIAWGKQSVSDVIRDLIDQHKESLSKLSKLSKQTV